MNELKKIAAIDIGTNSFHMIIASLDSNGLLNIIQREKEIVRLGNSPGDMKLLTEDAMNRGVETLKNFSKIAESENSLIKAIATSAVREADNKKDFIDRVLKETGIQIEVVSGREEGRLIYQGASRSLPVYGKKTLLIDIGGGSTELVVGLNGQVDYCNSTKIGTVRLSKMFFDKDEITNKDIESCINHIKVEWIPILNKVKNKEYDYVIATSGTLQNLITISNRKNLNVSLENSNGLKASKDQILNTIRKIKKLKTPSTISSIKGLDQSRADIILAGSLIVEVFLKHLNIEEMVVSSYALREGIFYKYYQLLNEDELKSSISKLRLNTTKNLVRKYNLDINHSKYISKLCLKIFDDLIDIHKLDNHDREMLKVAAYLHDCGFYVSHDKHHKHSYYLILNTEMPGFTIQESELIANIARYHRKSHPKESHKNYTNLNDIDRKKVWILGGILRLVEGLDRRQFGLIENFTIKTNSKYIEFNFMEKEENDIDIEIWSGNRRKEMLEIALGLKIFLKKL